MTERLDELTAFGRALVRACGARLRDMRCAGGFAVEEKHGHSDLVTEHDRWAQRFLTEGILTAYPDHGVLGEEGEGRAGASPFSWVIDPIDGTTNYCQFGRDYAISLALLYRGRPIHGFVLDVQGNCLHEGRSAARSAPAAESPRQGVLHMGFKTMQEFAAMGADPYALAAQFRGVRYLGCASLEICAIAQQQAGFYVNSHLKWWDFAAAEAVLSSRGCQVAAAELSPGRYFVCAFRSPALYRQCQPFFPARARRALNEKGDLLHVTD